MERKLSSLLVRCQEDLRGLVHVKKYMEETEKAGKRSPVNRMTMNAMSTIIRNCSLPLQPDEERLTIILDILAHFTDGDQIPTWRSYINEFSDMSLRILTMIERTDKFHIFFIKLLSIVSEICKHSVNAWRHVIRPLFNVFINKKFSFPHLEESLAKFKKISRSVDAEELVRFTKINLHLVRGFSVMVQRTGDLIVQMEIIDLVFLYSGNDRKLVKRFFGKPEAASLLEKLQFENFGKDSRLFLNMLNSSLDSEKRVFSVNCNVLYFGSVALNPPVGMSEIWMDVNRDSRRITVTCEDFISDTEKSNCIILQLPSNEVRKLKVEFGSVTDTNCYCITIKINNLIEMYDFAKSNTLICTALTENNTQEAILDFARVIQEQSDQIHLSGRESSEDTVGRDEAVRPECKVLNTVNLTTIPKKNENGKTPLRVLSQGRPNTRSSTPKAVVQAEEGTEAKSRRKSESKRENVNSKANMVAQLFEEWVVSDSEDFIQTQEFVLEEKRKKGPKKGRRSTTKEVKCASLLDPDGYSYKRWQTSMSTERGKFWLNKLKKLEEKKEEAPSKDVFHFSEGDLSDESSAFVKPKRVVGRRTRKGWQEKKEKNGNKKCEKVENVRAKRTRQESCCEETRKRMKCDVGEPETPDTIKTIVDAVAASLTQGFDLFLTRMNAGEVESTKKYLKRVEEREVRMSEEALELKERRERLEKCHRFFLEGCSSVESGLSTVEEIKDFRSEVKILPEGNSGPEGDTKFVRFAGKLMDLLNARTEVVLERESRDDRVRDLESFISNWRK